MNIKNTLNNIFLKLAAESNINKMICNKCAKEKLAEEFYKKSGKPIQPCRQCKIKSVQSIQDEYYTAIVKERNKQRALLKRELRKKVTAESQWAANLVAGLRKRGRKKTGKSIPVDINVNKDFVMQIAMNQGFKCYYTGLTMVVGDNFKAPSLDRVDSAKGYTKDNVVLCCRGINYCKSEYSEMELRKFLYEIRFYTR